MQGTQEERLIVRPPLPSWVSVDDIPLLLVESVSCMTQVPDFRTNYGSPYTVDPLLKHVQLSVRDFYNFGDVRFAEQAPGAQALRDFYHNNRPVGMPQQPRRLRTSADVNPHHLHQLVTLFYVPLHARAPLEDTPAATPKRKIICDTVPGPAERFRMWFTVQGYVVWFSDKEISYGATTLSTVIGTDKFKFNDHLFEEDMMRLAKGVESSTSRIPLYHGTYFETEACWVASFVLGIFICECGMIPDSQRSASRMSPDRLCYVPSCVAWSRWMLYQRSDKLKHIAMEAKCPPYGVYQYGHNPKVWPYAHCVVQCYRTQLTDQTKKADLPANLFNVYWHMNQWARRKRVAGTDVFLVSEQLITMVFRNDAYAEVAYKHLDAHIDAIKRDTHPKRLHADDVDVPDLVMMPIAHVRFFIFGADVAGHGECNHTIVTSQKQKAGGGVPPFTSYSCACCRTGNSNMHRKPVPWDDVCWTARSPTDRNVGPRPDDWTGCWPPVMGSHIEWFHDALPIRMTAEMLDPYKASKKQKTQ